MYLIDFLFDKNSLSKIDFWKREDKLRVIVRTPHKKLKNECKSDNRVALQFS